jgi:hypothetical protein
MGGHGFNRRGIVHMATGAGVGMIGAVGLDYAWQWLSTNVIPVHYQSGYLGTAVKAATAVGAGWLASKVVSRHAAAAGTIGALTVIGYQLIHQMIASASPAAAIPATANAATPAVHGLRAYMPGTMGAYMPGTLGWTSPGSPLRGLGRRAGSGVGIRVPMPPQIPINRPGGSVSMSGLAQAGGWS